MQAAGAADRVFALTHPSDAAGKEAAAADGDKATAGSAGTLWPEGFAQGVLEFSNVDFCYPTRPNVPVLRDFSLAVEPGETVAVVGASGSGKSTLFSLLTALYTPSAGVVRFDGHPVSDLDPTYLRGQIGVVAQEPTIFGGTIGDNIAYGCGRGPWPSQEKIEAAAASANALGFIRALPDGFDTMVGERGVSMSGGQKQRIAVRSRACPVCLGALVG